jgi:hypothetical protein
LDGGFDVARAVGAGEGRGTERKHTDNRCDKESGGDEGCGSEMHG